MAIRTKNLNLIPILQALLQEQSVAKAADKIGLSQPAMSGALSKLRDHFDDPLLVRMGRTMRLTPRAEKLRAQLDDVCIHIEQLFQPEVFDPKTAKRNFVIAAPDYIALLLTGSLVLWLREEAPGINISFVDITLDLPDMLKNAVVDLAVCANFGTWENLRHEHIYDDRIVAVVGKEHPLRDCRKITTTALAQYPSVDYYTIVLSSFNRTQKNFVTGIPSLDLISQLSTSQFTDAVLLATRLPIVARAPESLVKWLSDQFPLVTIELEENSRINKGMFWAPTNEASLDHQWLRQVIKQKLQALVSASRA